MKLIIIGGGNSIRIFPNLWDDIKGMDVMTINYSYKHVKETPKYHTSIDNLFWKNNIFDMDVLEKKGCKLINRKRKYETTKEICQASKEKLFTGQRKLSGMFALSYATQHLNYDKIYLFGFDFGVVDDKTHYYDNIQHSGINKDRAYLDKDKQVLKCVYEFDYYKNYNISIVGKSNVVAFKQIDYKTFLKEVKYV